MRRLMPTAKTTVLPANDSPTNPKSTCFMPGDWTTALGWRTPQEFAMAAALQAAE